MIEIIHGDRVDPGRYIAFCQDIYRGSQFFRDSGLTGVLRMIFQRREIYSGYTEITPVMVIGGGEILAACLLMVAREQPETLQLSFFEAREGCQPAVDLLVAGARSFCQERGLSKIVVGLDNTVGILTDHFDCVPCYGTRYNPPYYPDYFSKYGAGQYTLTSYLLDLNRFSLAGEQKILDRIGRRFTCRPADWRRLGQESALYTWLKNRCFAGQPFFAPGSAAMNYQMFNSYRSLISGQNLLILERGGSPAGYLLWFPDYNQLLEPECVMGWDTCRSYRTRGHDIDKIIISEIGVLPEYRGSGAILALFDRIVQLAGGHYDWCETGWILDSNTRSKGFGIRWADQEYKHYKLFEIGA
jgi:hypothetical protein